MASNDSDAQTGLVHAIFALTNEQRHAPHVQAICQYIYCKFSIDDHDENNEACHVTTTKLTLFDDVQTNDNFDLKSIAKYITLYIYPIFIFIGIFGNSLSCFIMFRNVRRYGYSANLYLTLLAFVDCIYLVGSSLPHWISEIDSKFDVKLFSNVWCRLVYWFGHFTTHLSAGLVVSVTVERFIAIQYPLLARKLNTVSHTHIVLIILISFFFFLDSRVFILVKHSKESIHIVSTCHNNTDIKYGRRDIFRCDITNENNEQMWIFIDFAVYTLIPFLIIVTLNSLIIHRLIHAQRLRQSMSYSKGRASKYGSETLRRNRSDEHTVPSHKYTCLRRCRSAPSPKSPSIQQSSLMNDHFLHLSVRSSDVSTEPALEMNSRSDHPYEGSVIRQTANKNNRRLTILLLYVSFSFLVLTLPAIVFNLILLTTLKAKSATLPKYSKLTNYNTNANTNTMFYHAIIRLLMIINHSINFILYFVVGKRFRRDVKRLCLCY